MLYFSIRSVSTGNITTNVFVIYHRIVDTQNITERLTGNGTFIYKIVKLHSIKMKVDSYYTTSLACKIFTGTVNGYINIHGKHTDSIVAMLQTDTDTNRLPYIYEYICCC